MQKCKISVIVPVYKAEQYLDRCVESILAQSFRDFELILVDDGSPDRCPGMCDDWAEKDRRIKVIHKKNGGPQDAVKQGVHQAQGEYIAFVDSDDWAEPAFLQTLYDGAVGNCADLAQCNYRQVWPDKVQDHVAMPRIIGEQEIHSEFLPAMANYRIPGMRYSRWDKIYKTPLLRQALELCDSSVKMGEDFLMNYAVIGQCRKIVVLDTPPLYNYFFNESSIMGSYTPEKMLNQDALFENIKKISEAYDCPGNDISILRNREYMKYIYGRATTGQPRAERKKDIQRIIGALDRKTWLAAIRTMELPMDRIGMYLNYFGLIDLELLLVDLSAKYGRHRD